MRIVISVKQIKDLIIHSFTPVAIIGIFYSLYYIINKELMTELPTAVNLIIAVTYACVLIFFVGLNTSERNYIVNLVKTKF